MPEVQTTTESGEMARRFIEFVLMHAQQASLCLGQIPHPQTGKTEVHLDMARLFIDQLIMVRSKTRGNLSDDEIKVLNNTISTLQMAFVEASAREKDKTDQPAAASGPAASTSAAPEPSGDDGGSKRKFTKSYGP